VPFDLTGQSTWLPTVVTHRVRATRLVLEAEQEAEHQIQIQCAKAFDTLLLADVAWTAIDSAFSLNRTIGRNGREIGWGEVAKRKARGVKSGVPDFAFWHDFRAYAIELKTVDGVLSDNQKRFLNELIRAGVEVSVCRSFTQVLNKVSEWGLTRGFVVSP
jgi:VRR-NUC domain-containing protein